MTAMPKHPESPEAAAQSAGEKAVKTPAVRTEAPKPVKTEAPKPVKTEALKPVKAEAPKAEAKKAPAGRKPAARKAAGSKEAKVNIVVEYQDRQINQENLLAGARKVWAQAGQTAAIEAMDLYVKPEDGAVYCVINGESVGKFSF